MQNIDGIVRAINVELTPLFEERLREALAHADREWLIDQVVRLTLDAHSLQEIDRRIEREAKARARAERLERVTRLEVDYGVVADFIRQNIGLTGAMLRDSGMILQDAPASGLAMIEPWQRSEAGNELLERAKDMLFALLFGDAASNTALVRVQQELLTFALPRAKASALDFMRASTELAAAGTWQDPHSVSNDERADNVVLEVQFGEIAEEVVGTGVVTALTIINALEVNEQVLYARMINVEETTLIGG